MALMVGTANWHKIDKNELEKIKTYIKDNNIPIETSELYEVQYDKATLIKSDIVPYSGACGQYIVHNLYRLLNSNLIEHTDESQIVHEGIYVYNYILNLKRFDDFGFSLYTPLAYEYLKKNAVRFNFLEVPYSVYDRRFEEIIKRECQNGTTIAVRSIFFKNQSHLDKKSMLKFVMMNPHIDYIIIGIDNARQLDELYTFYNNCINFAEEERMFDQYRIDDEVLLLMNYFEAL